MKNTRFIALLLVIAMVLGLLVGCGGDADVPGGNVTPNSGTSNDTNNDVNNDTNNDSADTSGDQAANSNGDLGRMEGGTYTNTYTGYAITLNENWEYYTAEELQDLPDNAKELFADSELADDMEKYTMIADMSAESVADLASINVQYQKLSLAERLAYKAMSADQVVDTVLAQKDALISTYQSAGMTNITIEKTTANFLGEQRPVVATTLTNEYDVVCHIVQIQHFNLGAYGVTLTVSTYGDDNTQAILDMFTKA